MQYKDVEQEELEDIFAIPRLKVPTLYSDRQGYASRHLSAWDDRSSRQKSVILP